MEPETKQFARALREKIRKQMNDLSDDMINGQCADFPAYREVVGLIRGLGVAERELLDLAQELEKELNSGE